MSKFIFYRASEQEALDELAGNPDVTPFSKQITQYYIYKGDIQGSIDPRLTEEISDVNLDGLTPVDPTKPMFPKK